VKQKPSGGGGGNGGGGGGADFQDVGSQFWDLDFTQWASHDLGSTQLHSVRRSCAPTSTHKTTHCSTLKLSMYRFEQTVGLEEETKTWKNLDSITTSPELKREDIITHN